MKRVILFSILGFFLLSSYAAFSQNRTHKNKMWRRIVFTQKKNAQYKKMPSILIKAFCEGRLPGYFPNEPETQATFSSFAYNFDFNLEMDKIENEQGTLTPCIENQCASIDPWTMRCFSIYLDVYEEEYFDRRKSRPERDVKLLRLVYSYTCSDTGLEYYGPVFRYSDLEKLSERFRVPVQNKKGERTFSMQQILLQKLYDSVIVEHNGEMIPKPAKYTAEYERKRTDREVNFYEN